MKKQLRGLAFLNKKFLSRSSFNHEKTVYPSLYEKAMDIIFPDNLYCLCCGDCIDRKTRIHSLCDSCIKKINWISDNPYASSMEDFAFDELFSCCIYGALPGKIIHDFKLNGHKYISRPVGKLMAERAEAELADQSVLPEEYFDGICCIPITKEKKNMRGFNQAELLAKEVSKQLGIPFWKVLSKSRETVSLRLSSDLERRTALSGVFEIESHFFCFDPRAGKKLCIQRKKNYMSRDMLKGSHILLIDDVFTTGSTMNEAALTLKNAGASKVTALVFACGTGRRQK